MQQASGSWSNAFNLNNIPQMPYNNMGANPLNQETSAWAHTVPHLMPWTDDPRPDVVHFTAPPDPCTSQTATSWELMNHFGSYNTNMHSHLKRKSDLDVPNAAPPKVCITEERMAARFRDMHISNQYHFPSPTSSSAPELSLPDKSVTNLHQLDSILKDSDSTSKSLVLAPEIKKLIEPERIFNQTFLTKVERPSMAVVLWQPQNQFKEKNSSGESSKEDPPANFSQLSDLCSQNILSTDIQPEPVDDEMETIYS